MKILLFYVSHRQTEEILYSSLFFNMDEWLKNHAEIFIYCNNKDFNTEFISCLASTFLCKTHIYCTEKNAGYILGLFEAAYDMYDSFLEYDYIILLHPDVYIIDSTFLQNEIINMMTNNIIFSASSPTIADNENTWGYHSNFIIWKPLPEIKERFAIYKEFEKHTPKMLSLNDFDRDFGPESLIMKIIKDSGLKYNIWFRPTGNHISIANGILHEHDNNYTWSLLNDRQSN